MSETQYGRQASRASKYFAPDGEVRRQSCRERPKLLKAEKDSNIRSIKRQPGSRTKSKKRISAIKEKLNAEIAIACKTCSLGIAIIIMETDVLRRKVDRMAASALVLF